MDFLVGLLLGGLVSFVVITFDFLAFLFSLCHFGVYLGFTSYVGYFQHEKILEDEICNALLTLSPTIILRST
jgi:hypothetical protein